MNNQRKIKFRIWDNELKVFHDPRTYTGSEQGLQPIDPLTRYLTSINYDIFEDDPIKWQVLHQEYCEKRFILQQFTGLKDKNGKEIFEGDIIKWKYGSPETSVIKWISENDGWDYSGWKTNHNYSQGGPIEIVGNIFENPNLLV